MNEPSLSNSVLSLSYCCKIFSICQLVGHINSSKVALQSLTTIIYPTFVNMATPKAEAKHELLFDNPSSVQNFMRGLTHKY